MIFAWIFIELIANSNSVQIRPKSVRNRCVIEVFGGVFVLSRCFLDFSVGVGAFVIGLSQISFFFFEILYTRLAQWSTKLRALSSSQDVH